MGQFKVCGLLIDETTAKFIVGTRAGELRGERPPMRLGFLDTIKSEELTLGR